MQCKKYLIFFIVQFFLHTKHSLVIIHTLCYLEIVIRYFHLTTFYWMFIEGGQWAQDRLPAALLSTSFLQVCICSCKFSSRSLSPQ